MPLITKRLIDSIGPAGTEHFIWDEGDGALKGFGVRVKPSGVASYLVQYRNATGQTRRMVLGRVGVITPDQGRKAARDKLAEVANGADPSEERHALRQEMTIGELCDWYLIEAAAGRLLGRKGRPIKPSTLAMDKSRIEQHIKPLIGSRPQSWLTLERIGELQNDIAAGKTAKARKATGRSGKTKGGRGVAGRTVGMLGAIIEHGRRHGKWPKVNGTPTVNPARGVRRFSDRKVDRFLDHAELVTLGRVMREVEAEGWSHTGLAAIRALLLTGCRKSEMIACPRRWFVPAARCMRYGDTKSDAQIRPLGKAAIDHLAEQPEGDWLFPADQGEGHFVGINGLLDRLVERCGFDPAKGRVTPHVFRHTFGSVATGLGYSELIIKALLGHARRGATQTYAHAPDPALLTVADRVSECIRAALEGQREAEVIPLRVAV
jgi:integrase